VELRIRRAGLELRQLSTRSGGPKRLDLARSERAPHRDVAAIRNHLLVCWAVYFLPTRPDTAERVGSRPTAA